MTEQPGAESGAVNDEVQLGRVNDMATEREDNQRPDSVSENYDDRNEAAEDTENATPVQSRPENVVEGAEGEGREAKPGGMNPVSSTEERGEDAPQGSLPGV